MQDQVKQLKLNVTNIKSYLISSNKTLKKLRVEKNNIIAAEQDQSKKTDKEKTVESPLSSLGKFGKTVGGIAKNILSGPLSFFDKIKEFFGLILTGIIINNLPAIIDQIKGFLDRNKWLVEGTKFILSAIGKGIEGIINLVSMFSSSEQNKINKDATKLRDEFSKLDKDLEGDDVEINKRLADFEKENTRTQRNERSPSKPTPSSTPARAQREPSTPPQPTAPRGQELPKYAKGGKVDTRTQPQARKTMTAGSSSLGSTKSSVRSKKAVQTVNYFSFFRNNTEVSEEIADKDAKNKDTFREILTSLKTIQEIRKQIGDDDSPGDSPYGSPPSNELLEYEVSGGEMPSSYPGRGTSEHGYPGRDYQIPVGRAITAFVPGTVTYAGLNSSGYGNLVIIKHKNGKESYYAHLSKINVNVGDEIKENERKMIGLTGGERGAPGAGNSTGPHLHFELRDENGRQITGYNDGDAYFRFGTVTGVRRITGVAGRPTGQQFSGEATVYARRFHGKATSTGETFNTNAYTAAIQIGLRDQFGGVSGTSGPGYAIVENLDNGRKIVVKINDVGPLAPGRVIDLSEASSKYLLNSRRPGSVGRVRVTRIQNGVPGPMTSQPQPGQQRASLNPSQRRGIIGEDPGSSSTIAYQPIIEKKTVPVPVLFPFYPQGVT